MDDLDQQFNFLFYQGKDGKTKIQVFLDRDNETIWATQKGMSEIFDTTRENITLHLKNVFQSDELEEDSVCKKILHTAEDNKKYNTNIYNLDAIISVGYRINSKKATKFRKWATKIIKEFLIKGFVLDDERLKQGKDAFGKDYFDELLERIREIRISERRFYQKITDIYAQCSIDYDPNSSTTKNFYAIIQNKLHYAIHHNTAAEIIKERANCKKPFMGLTSWKNEKIGGKILKGDIHIAKNYLTNKELEELNYFVSQYLDYAEGLARRNIALTMQEWADRLDAFIKFNEYEVLNNAGKVSSYIAKKIANNEYEKYRIIQDREYKSDFDKIVHKIKTKKIPSEKHISSYTKTEDSIENNEPLTDFDKKLDKAIKYNPRKGK